MRFVILHYHIFKNAGSTIEDILDFSFGARFSRLGRSDRSGVISNAEIVRYLDAHPKLRAISSHQIRQPVAEAPGYLFFEICFLRDPLDRLRSYYDYFRLKPDPADPISDLANRCSLRDFVAGMIADFPSFVKNAQVNFLACGGASEAPDEADLQLAIRRFLTIPFPGVVDCFHESAIAGTWALRSAFPELDCGCKPANVSRGLEGTVADRLADLREQCGEDIYWTLRRLTALDQRLVNIARKEVLRRYSMTVARTAEATAGGLRNSRIRASIDSSRFETARCVTIEEAQPGRFAEAGEQILREGMGLMVMARRMISRSAYGRRLVRISAAGRDHFGLSLQNLLQGVYRGMQPQSLFDGAFYLRRYPDVAAAGMDPLCHYLQYGSAESRQPHPLFDPVYYLSHNPDVKESGMDPLIHYVEKGAMEDRKPHPLFEPSYYRVNAGIAEKDAASPLLHFLKRGGNAAQPHPLFDCRAYIEANPEVADRGLNPLIHYLELSSEQDRFAAKSSANSGVSMRVCGASIVELDLDDVRLVVFCLGDNPGQCAMYDPDERQAIHATATSRAARLRLRGSVAIVWVDSEGVTRWIAEPQQLPFLRGVGIGQIRAQRLRQRIHGSKIA